MITEEKMIEIFETSDYSKWEGDNAFKGLLILSKYTNNLIGAAEHDIIYSEDIDKLIEAGITEEDCIALRNLNWMIDGDCGCMACFV